MFLYRNHPIQQNLLALQVLEVVGVDVRGRYRWDAMEVERGVSEVLHGWLTLGADGRKLGKYGKCRGTYGHEAVGRDPKVLGDLERARDMKSATSAWTLQGGVEQR